jgi:hypothetical protein
MAFEIAGGPVATRLRCNGLGQIVDALDKPVEDTAIGLAKDGVQQRFMVRVASSSTGRVSADPNIAYGTPYTSTLLVQALSTAVPFAVTPCIRVKGAGILLPPNQDKARKPTPYSR